LGRVLRWWRTGTVTGRGRGQAACLAVPLALAVLVAACSGDDDDAAGGREASSSRDTTATSAAESTTTLSAADQEEQAVRDAHQAALQARIDSAAPPDPDPELPALLETHTGLMLEEWQSTVRALELNNFVIRYPENSVHRSEVESVRFDEVDGVEVAYLEVCSVDDGERFSTGTGSVLSGGVKTVQATEAMRKEDGVWKLAERQENSVDEGVTGCAAD
jgi:hypothetical protein